MKINELKGNKHVAYEGVKRPMHWIKITIISLIFTLMGSTCYSEEFPYRNDYPNVPIVELEQLKTGYDNGSFVIVDVRSSIEFETIHPKGALHVSLSNANFTTDLKIVSAKNPGKKIAVYCNGVTCLKSYNAAQKAVDAGMTNVYAFDAGIPAWAKAFPAETLLVGKPIDDPEKQLIPKSQFKKKTIDFAQFQKLALSPNAKVIDARDPMQRSEKLPGVDKVLPIPIEKLIRNIINHDRMKDNQLIIFDQVGKQVRWVMYHLEDKGYVNYYFLKGGATAVLKEQKYR